MTMEKGPEIFDVKESGGQHDLLQGLMARGKEVLRLDEAEAVDMGRVLRKLLQGPLDEADEQKLANWLGRYEEASR